MKGEGGGRRGGCGIRSGDQSCESIDSLYKPLPRTAVLDVSCVDMVLAPAAPARNRPGDNEVRGAVCVRGVVRGNDDDGNTDNDNENDKDKDHDRNNDDDNYTDKDNDDRHRHNHHRPTT